MGVFVMQIYGCIFALIYLVWMKLSNSNIIDRFFLFARSCYSLWFFFKQLIGNISNVLLICFTIKIFVSFSNWQICCNLMLLFLSRRNFFKCVDFETCTVLIYVQCFQLLRALSFFGCVSVMEGQKNLIF